MLSFVLTACGTPAAAPTQPPAATQAPAATQPPAKVTVTWWHISTAEDHKALLQKKADEYMAAHPNVTIEVTVLENEAFKSKLTTVMQSGEPPDIFQSWGGGVMNEYVKAGLLKDITADLDQGGWRDTFSPGALGVYAPIKARITACRGIWAWSAFGTTKTCSRKLGLMRPPPLGRNCSPMWKRSKPLALPPSPSAKATNGPATSGGPT